MEVVPVEVAAAADGAVLGVQNGLVGDRKGEGAALLRVVHVDVVLDRVVRHVVSDLVAVVEGEEAVHVLHLLVVDSDLKSGGVGSGRLEGVVHALLRLVARKAHLGEDPALAELRGGLGLVDELGDVVVAPDEGDESSAVVVRHVDAVHLDVLLVDVVALDWVAAARGELEVHEEHLVDLVLVAGDGRELDLVVEDLLVARLVKEHVELVVAPDNPTVLVGERANGVSLGRNGVPDEVLVADLGHLLHIEAQGVRLDEVVDLSGPRAAGADQGRWLLGLGHERVLVPVVVVLAVPLRVEEVLRAVDLKPDDGVHGIDREGVLGEGLALSQRRLAVLTELLLLGHGPRKLLGDLLERLVHLVVGGDRVHVTVDREHVRGLLLHSLLDETKGHVSRRVLTDGGIGDEKVSTKGLVGGQSLHEILELEQLGVILVKGVNGLEVRRDVLVVTVATNVQVARGDHGNDILPRGLLTERGPLGAGLVHERRTVRHRGLMPSLKVFTLGSLGKGFVRVVLARAVREGRSRKS
mmetsp:Transcript_510/g.935  ORF Transcript_510/g.935 Transcript_510/m.935 type:complete len:525 (-) Transcript_510:152-1726(-)